MFKKRLLCLLLSFSLLCTLLPAAYAQPDSYRPGQAASLLVREAFRSGQMLCVDTSIALDLNPGMFGVTGEDAEAVQQICEILRDASVTIGAARIPDGFALLLRAAHGDKPVSADLILSLTADGAAFESSLLPGERLFVSWEAFLEMAGLDKSLSTALLGLRSADPEQLMQFVTQSLALSQTAVSLAAAPYLDTLSDFIAEQPTQVQHDIPAEGYFPAAATESILLITQKAAGELLLSLCTQLEQDLLLAPLLSAAVAGVTGDHNLNTPALCAALRETAAAMTDEQYPLCFITGYDEAGKPLYTSVCISDADGGTYALNLVDMQSTVSEAETGCLLQAFFADEKTYTGLTASFFFTDDPIDPLVRTFGAAAEFQLDNAFVFSGEYILDTQSIAAEDGRLLYDTVHEYALEALLGGSVLSIAGNSHAERGTTEDGGEYSFTDSAAEGYLGEVLITQTDSQSSFLLSPAGNGFEGQFSGQYTAPQQGVDGAKITCRLYTQPYLSDAEAAVLVLDDASGEAVDAMLLRLQENAEALLDTLIDTLIPQLPEVPHQQLTDAKETFVSNDATL